MANGFGLVVPDDLLNKLDQVDKKIEDIATSSERTSATFVSAFKDMANGIDPLTNALKDVISKQNDISAGSKGISDFGNAMDKASEQAQGMSSSITQAAENINRMSGSKGSFFSGDMNIAELKDNISHINTTLKDSDANLSRSSQQELVNRRNALQAELREQELTTQQRIALEQKVSESVERETQKEKDDYLKSLNDKIRAAQQYAMRQQEILNKQNTARLSTPTGAIGFAESATSINQRTQAIKYLTAARANLNTTDADYSAKLSNINGKIREMNAANAKAVEGAKNLSNQHRHLMDTTGQLARQFALLFSVSQISGYISKMVSVRGEFEMAQVSLEAILQDKDGADKLFGQITQLAVQSPFRVKDLVSYTKQLAAYRVEEKDLYDTTKRLADVSAGLGVDMNRLVLAYGQVKAASYLRGQEVRQFTEAGINLYSELAKHFTAIKGEAVTTADVVNMIPKRLVKFEDVKAVFDNLTNSGGIFYNMQEKQSQTLQGQISNLADKLDLMFNDIGKSQQGALSGAINFVSDVLANWREYASVLETVGAAIISFKSVAMFNSIVDGLSTALFSLKDALEGAKIAQNGLNLAMSKNSIGFFISLVTTLSVAIYEIISNANHLKNALNDIKEEGAFNASESVAQYKLLADTVRDTSKSYQEHQQALQTLQQKYGDILPAQMLSEKGILNIRDNYKSATAAIYEYINAKTKEKEIEEISNSIGRDLNESQDNLAKTLANELSSLNKVKVSMTDIVPSIVQLRKELDSGKISTKDAGKELEKLISYSTGLNTKGLITFAPSSLAGNAKSDLNDFLGYYSEYQSKIKEINSENINAFDSSTEKSLNKTKQLYQNYANAAANALNVIKQKGISPGSVSTSDLDKAEKTIVKMYDKLGITISNRSAYFKSLLNNGFKINDETVRVNQTALKKVFDTISSARFPKSQLGIVSKWLQSLGVSIRSLNVDPLHRAVQKMIVDFATMNHLNLNGLTTAMWQANESMADYSKRMSTTMKELQQKLELNSIAGSLFYGKMSKADVSKNKAFVRLYKTLSTATMQGDDADKYEKEQERIRNKQEAEEKKRRAAELKAQKDITQERINLLKSMYEEFKKYSEVYDSSTAAKKVIKAFYSALKGVKMPSDVMSSFVPSQEGILKAYRKLISTVKDSKQRAELRKIISETTLDIDTQNVENSADNIKNNIDEIIDSLNRYNKLREAGLTKSQIESMFSGIVTSTDMAKKQIDDISQSAHGEKEIDAVVEGQKQIQKIIKDNTINTFDELVKTYRNTMSDQLQIDLWYAQERQKIIENTSTPDKSDIRNQMLSNLQKEYNQKTNTEALKQFQGGDAYVTLFDNIDKSSTAALESMKKYIDSLKGSLKDLNPTDLKTIMDSYNKIQEQLSKRNPFAALANDFKELGKAKQAMKDLGVSESELTIYDAESTKLKQQLDDINAIINIKKDGNNVDMLSGDILARNTDNVGKSVDELNGEKVSSQATLDILNQKIKAIQTYLDVLKTTNNDTQNASDKLQSLGNSTIQAFTSIVGLMSAMGQEEDSNAAIFEEMGANIAQAILQMVEFILQAKALGHALNSALGIIGLIVEAITIVATIITSIINAGDKIKTRQIKNLEDEIKNLSKAYERLKKAMDSALDVNALVEFNEQGKRAIREQIEDRQRQIALEEAKKKTDQSKIEDYKNDIQDLQDQLKDYSDNLTTKLGGFGTDSEIYSAANDFTQAWLDAFNSTGDGMDALSKKMEDWVNQMLEKQILTKLAQNYIQPLIDSFNNMVSEQSEGGTSITASELKAWKTMYNTSSKKFNEQAKSLMDAMGQKPTGISTSDSLQQGIQSVSESTADALEAYMNSIRFFVSQQTTDVSAIRMMLTNYLGSLNVTPSGDNVTLSELRSQTALLNSINTSITSVLRDGHTKGGKGLKVFMD